MNTPQERLISFIPRLAGKRVLVVGDLMLDEYLLGDADRLSPEAPVPVVSIAEERCFLGGAGNVARNVASLGGIPSLVGQVGCDVNADKLRSILNEHGIKHTLTESAWRPTTVKTRVLARRQQMLRLDRENASPFREDELEAILAAVDTSLPSHDVIVLSDYAKGLMSPAFMNGLKKRIATQNRDIRVLIDPKPSNIACYQGATMLTPNTRETGECSSLPVSSREEILAAGRAILSRTGSPHLLTTLGPDGMALFLSQDEVWHIPTVAQDVFDVTGAGDTVIATVSLAISAGLELLPSCELANYAAGIVVARVGAATVIPEELETAIRTLPTPRMSRWA